MVFANQYGLSIAITNHAPRSTFTTDEKSAYLDAALCLTTAAPTIGLGDSATLWQEMQYAHIGQVTWIHNVVRCLGSKDDVFSTTDCCQGPIPSLASLLRYCSCQFPA
jgi:hypothetical protein